MADIKKIVCAVDLADQISPVVDYANTLAKLMNASLVVVYAVPTLSQYRGFMLPSHQIVEKAAQNIPGDGGKGMKELVKDEYAGVQQASIIDEFVNDITKGAQKSMEAYVQKHFADVEAKGVVVNGDPAEQILNLVKQENADMIVMGTRGLKGIDRFLVGSVAEKVVQRATCPVFTVRPHNHK